MKRLGTVAALLLLVASGCETQKSRLDTVAKTDPKAPAAAPSVQADHSGDLESRVRRLEDNWAKYAEALDFLQKVFQQQKGQQQQQERDELDPAAMFAVDIQQSVAAGLIEGSPTGAAVTIVEAWDFA